MLHTDGWWMPVSLAIWRVVWCILMHLYGSEASHSQYQRCPLLKMSKFQHITVAVRDQLQWLLVKQRVEFKQVLFVYKVLHQIAPPYLADMCQLMSTSSTRRRLHSAAHGDLVELRYRTTRYGKRSFPASAPLIWNSLLTTVHDVSISINSFSGCLKVELFCRT